MVDYTTYPEGFKEMAKKLDLPQEGEAAREAFLYSVMKQLLIN